MKKFISTTALLMALATAPAIGADSTTVTDAATDAGQQSQIEQGLKSGQLSTSEASRLEAGQSRIDQAEAQAGKNGSISGTEQTRITSLQNQESAAITRDETNSITGNPSSRSNRRLEAGVKHAANQEASLQAGAANGSLSDKEVASLEAGQARTTNRIAVVGADGRLTSTDQAHLLGGQKNSGVHVYNQGPNGAGNGTGYATVGNASNGNGTNGNGTNGTGTYGTGTYGSTATAGHGGRGR